MAPFIATIVQWVMKHSDDNPGLMHSHGTSRTGWAMRERQKVHESRDSSNGGFEGGQCAMLSTPI